MKVTKEYYDMYSNELEFNKFEEENKVQLSRDKRQQMRRKEFIERFSSSPQFGELKDRLVFHVTQICNQCFQINKDIKGVFMNEEDRVFSELFQIMLNCAKQAMKEQIEESRDKSVQEKFGNTINSNAFNRAKIERIIEGTLGDTKKERFIHLIEEYEEFGLSNLSINRAKLLIDEGHTDVIPKYCQVLLQSSEFAKAKEYIS